MQAATSRRGFHAAVLIALTLVGPCASAQPDFPERPITLVVGASAGGGVDAAARLIALQFAAALHQPVVVEDRPGAYSRIAYGIVTKSVPDGHTLMVATATAAIDIAVDPKASPNALDDFVPVSPIASSDLVIVVAASLPVHTVSELIAYARERPGLLNFSTPGARTTHHLEGVLFMHRAGIDVVHVPFKGLAAALSSLASGDVEMCFSSIPAALPFIRAGKVRALAVASPTRSPLLPDVPTMKESGVDGVDTAVWYAILAPAGTPSKVVNTLSRVIQEASRSADYRDALANIGATPFALTPDEFGKLLHDEVAKWRNLIEVAHVSVGQ